MHVNSGHNKINASCAICGYLHKSCYVNEEVHTVRKEIENCHKQNLGKEIQAFLCTILQSDIKTHSMFVQGEKAAGEMCLCAFFFFSFNFPEESCQIRCMGDTARFPLSGSIWRSGGVQASSCSEALGIALFMSNDCDWEGLEVNHCCDERHPERMGLT